MRVKQDMSPSPKPKLGQNFLRDDRAQHAIVSALGDVHDSTVVEIGPGQGALTHLLTGRGAHLIVIELDRTLAAALRTRYAHDSGVTVIEGDVLSVDLCTLASDAAAVNVIGNLPYYITSDILLSLFAASERCRLHRAVLMMQREIAERVVSPPGSSDYGVLSATAQLHATAELLFTLPPSAFSPPPAVESSVVRLQFRSRFAELAVDRAGFLRFLRASFAQKRKTLVNNLRAAGYPARAVESAWPASMTHHVRAEAVSLGDMAQLYRNLDTAEIVRTEQPSAADEEP